MRREDIMVEVRDRNMQRRGQITTKYLKLSATIRHNKTGDWKLTLPGAHPMVPHLSAAGAGIVVSYRANPAFSNVWSTLFSGPTSLPSRKRNREQPDGTFVFEGRTDDQLLDDARAYPQPGNADVSTQNVANDVRTGNAESLMRQYVAFNIANGAAMPAPVSWAPAGRLGGFRNFVRITQANGNRGPTVTKSPRFQILSELLSEIGTYAQLGFQLVQRNDFIEFEVLPIADRSAFVRFDIANGSLTSEEVQVTPPAVTRAIVAGQGEGAERTIIQRTTTASSEAETAWGRIIERFIDQRDTNDLVELQQSGDEALIEEGFVATNVKVVPADDTTMLFVRDWNVGDTVTVVVNGQETKTTVTEAVLLVDSDRCVIGAAIGDVRGFNAQDALTKRVEDTERRVERMERTVEIDTTPIYSQTEVDNLLKTVVPAGVVQPFSGFTPPTGYLLCDGASVSRATYAALFAALNRSRGAVTMTLATPGVVTLTGSLPNGTRVWFTTTGALPTGLSANTTYYVVNAATNTFQLSATQGGAAIATSGTQSGVHTLWESAAGVASSTNFNLPDLRGRVPVGVSSSDEDHNAPGETGGRKTSQHGYIVPGINSGSLQAGGSTYENAAVAQLNNHFAGSGNSTVSVGVSIQSVGGQILGGGTGGIEVRDHLYTAPNLQPYMNMHYIIKT